MQSEEQEEIERAFKIVDSDEVSPLPHDPPTRDRPHPPSARTRASWWGALESVRNRQRFSHRCRVFLSLQWVAVYKKKTRFCSPSVHAFLQDGIISQSELHLYLFGLGRAPHGGAVGLGLFFSGEREYSFRGWGDREGRAHGCGIDVCPAPPLLSLSLVTVLVPPSTTANATRWTDGDAGGRLQPDQVADERLSRLM